MTDKSGSVLKEIWRESLSYHVDTPFMQQVLDEYVQMRAFMGSPLSTEEIQEIREAAKKKGFIHDE